jgi:membrane-bound serine protease (ClpP class)
MRKGIILQFLFFVLSVLPFSVEATPYKIDEISILSINSAITPATYDYLNQHFKVLPKSSLIVLKMNTPGGLISTTKDIITMIGREKRPLAVWITPEGASASSAGAIIASAAHFIFMSPGTNMGAATPVGLGEDIKEGDGRKKALNDLTALVRSLSHSRGRPAAPFEKMITGAESFTDSEALKLGIIEGVVSSQYDLVSVIGTKTFQLDGQSRTLDFSGKLNHKEYELTLGQKILEVLANPSTAYFLFLIGVALIYFELQAPGGFIAGAVGVCFLLLAGIAFQILPLNWGSMGLIAAGILLFVMEVFIVSYGILTIAGLLAFIMGSLFLFKGEEGLISIEYPVILSTLAGVVTSVGIIIWYVIREKRHQMIPSSFFLPVGSTGTVLTVTPNRPYQMKIRGEIWRGTCDEDLAVDDKIEVLSVNPEELSVKVKKL